MAQAEEYGATLYQRLPAQKGGGRRAGRVLLALAALVALAVAGGGATASAAQQSTEFRVTGFEHEGGVSHLTVAAPVALAEDPPPVDRIEVVDSSTGEDLVALVERLPAGRLEVVIVADVSGEPGTVETIQDDLREFVLSLPDGSAVATVAAGKDPHLVASLTRSPDSALAGLALLQPGDPGLPESAIDLGLDQLTGTPGTHPVVVEVRTGSYRSSTSADAPLDATRDRLERLGVDVYAVHLGTLLRPGAEQLPVPTGGGFVIEALTNEDLLDALDTISQDLSLPRYRINIPGLDGPRGVKVQSSWHSVRSEVVTVVGPAPTTPPRQRPAAPGPSLPKVAAAVGAVALVAAILLLPPRRRRRREARQADLPPARADVALAPNAPAEPAPVAVTPTGLGGTDVEGTEAVRALLADGRRPVGEVWVADDVEPATRAELGALAAARRVPVRPWRRSGAALPVAARAAPLVPVATDALWAAEPRAVVVAVAGTPSPTELGAALRAAGGDSEGRVVAGLILPRQPSSRITPATAAAAAGAVERLPIALVPDLGAALAAARGAGVRVVGVTGSDAGAGPEALAELAGPTVVVLPAAAELDRRLRGRCDAVVGLGGAHLAGRVAALVAALASRPREPEADPRAGAGARSLSR